MRQVRYQVATHLFAIISACCLAGFASTQQLPQPQQIPDQQPPPPVPIDGDVDNNQMRTQMRGPVHEAFAAPYTPDVTTSFTVPKQPPQPIEEYPAPIRPDDENLNAIWIPGYWGWDGVDRFVWVSGTWRYAPPEMRWIPGYWVQVREGYRWVPGFWIRDDEDNLAYLPPPPEPKEQGPEGRAPSENHFWVPGCWLYQGGRYVWRDGFWSRAREEWVWVPCHYCWTPRGYIFVDGFWDYPLDERGLLFAPADVVPGFRGAYMPQVVVHVEPLLVHLFVEPQYCHYFFGDYYTVAERRRGFYPWFAFAQQRTWYDPLLTFYRTTRYNYYERVWNRHNYFVKHRDLRPPHTWREYQKYVVRHRDQLKTDVFLGSTVKEVIRSKGDRRIDVVPKQYLEQNRKARQFYQDFVNQRQKFERIEKKGPPPKKEIRFPVPDRLPPGQVQPQPGKGKGKGKGKVDIPPGQQKKDRRPPGQIRRELPEPPAFRPAPRPGKGPDGPPPGKGKGKGKGNDKGKGKGKGKGNL